MQNGDIRSPFCISIVATCNATIARRRTVVPTGCCAGERPAAILQVAGKPLAGAENPGIFLPPASVSTGPQSE